MMSYGVIQMHILWWVFVFIAGSHVVSCERKKSNILYLPLKWEASSTSIIASASLMSALSSIKEIYVDCKIAICLSANKQSPALLNDLLFICFAKCSLKFIV